MSTLHEGAELRVAVVGSGPSGFFTAAAILKAAPAAKVNMFERLPTPWGLLRAGVAPDHENMRAVGAVFDRTAEDPRFRLLANVEVGVDVGHAELLVHHHAVVYATGALTGRAPHLAAGSNLDCLTADRVVGWYNGHPDYAQTPPNLSSQRAVVVGNGNVALDVARMLTRPVEDLRTTDISDLALLELEHSNVREVVILGRRGPIQAGFTLPELLELEKMSGVGVDLELGESMLAVPADAPTTLKAKVEALARLGARDDLHTARRIVFKFMTQPVSSHSGPGFSELRVARTRLDDHERAVQTDALDTISTSLVVWAVGFQGAPIPGVPFDNELGVIPNDTSRVLDGVGGQSVPATYVAGWIKRGPSGVIGENKRCGAETAAAVIADYTAGELTRHLPEEAALDELLLSRNVEVVDFAGWKRINDAERDRGRQSSRPRVKYVTREALLDVAQAASDQDQIRDAVCHE